eukprot:COSAG03_NODE_1682_length_3652_cov_2.986772_1_plen_199_part_00
MMEDLERVPNPASSVDGTTVGIDVEAAVREGTLTAEQGLGVLHIYTLGVCVCVCVSEVVVRGVVWCQGIDDALGGPAFAHAYQDNLSGLVLALRRRFRCPGAVFVPARSVNSAFALNKDGGSGVDAPMAVVRRAQVAVANALGRSEAARGRRAAADGSNSGWVDVDDLPNVNTHHFSMESQLEIGRRLGVVMGRQLLE